MLCYLFEGIVQPKMPLTLISFQNLYFFLLKNTKKYILKNSSAVCDLTMTVNGVQNNSLYGPQNTDLQCFVQTHDYANPNPNPNPKVDL